MKLVIVPESLRAAIDEKLDAALAGFPEHSAEDREVLYGQLLNYFDEHGVVPDFHIERNQPA